jgi:hypothetical protein
MVSGPAKIRQCFIQPRLSARKVAAQSTFCELSQHSWVLGIDNLAKWQKNMMQLKRFGEFLAINLQILNKQIIQKTSHFSEPQERDL